MRGPVSEGVAYFAVKSIGLSTVGGRKPCKRLDAVRHNLREIQAEIGADGHIDPRRSASNVILFGPGTAVAVESLALELLARAETSKLKRDHCQAIEAVFSLPIGAQIDGGMYFAKCLDWVAPAFGLPVLSAVIHHDEARPHMHVLLLPVRDGRHVGSKPIGRPEVKNLRTSFFAKVAGPAGFRHEGAKMHGKAKEWAVAAVLAICEAQGLPSTTGPLWPVLLDAIKSNPLPYLRALSIDPATLGEPAPQEVHNGQDATSHSGPIGLQSNGSPNDKASPIGFEKQMQKHQALSCVGLHQNTASKRGLKVIKAGVCLRPVLRGLLSSSAPRLRLADVLPRPGECAQAAHNSRPRASLAPLIRGRADQ